MAVTAAYRPLFLTPSFASRWRSMFKAAEPGQWVGSGFNLIRNPTVGRRYDAPDFELAQTLQNLQKPQAAKAYS